MKPKLLLILFLFQCYLINAQPTIQWAKSLGGSNFDFAYNAKQTYDGGYVIVGGSSSTDGNVTGNHGNNDYWITKLNASGKLQWQKSLGGSQYDVATDVTQTKDSGYIVIGTSGSNDDQVTGNHGGRDYWVIKVTKNGTIKWGKSYGGTADEVPSSIQQTKDGGYIIAGSTSSTDGDITSGFGSSDCWVIKLDAVGNIIWQKTYGGSNDESAHSIRLTSDGGYIVVGYSGSADGEVTVNKGAADYWIFKLDSVGNIQWQKSYGGSFNDFGYDIQQSSDTGYIVVGSSFSNNGNVTNNYGQEDWWIINLDKTGNLVWQKSYGSSSHDLPLSIDKTFDGNYVIAGSAGSGDHDVTNNYGFRDYWIIKIDGLGNLIWQKSLGGSSQDEGYSIKQTSDQGFVVAGYTSSNDGDVSNNHGIEDYWVVKLSPDVVLPLTLLNFTAQQQGKQVLLQWQTTNEVNMKNFVVERSNNSKDYSIIADIAAEGKSVLGNTYNATDDLPLYGTNYYRLKMINTDGTFAYSNIIQINASNLITSLKVFPNPTHALLNVQIKTANTGNIVLQISDASGRVINQKVLNSTGTTLSTSFNVGNLSGGIYYLSVEQNGNKQKAIFKIR